MRNLALKLRDKAAVLLYGEANHENPATKDDPLVKTAKAFAAHTLNIHNSEHMDTPNDPDERAYQQHMKQAEAAMLVELKKQLAEEAQYRLTQTVQDAADRDALLAQDEGYRSAQAAQAAAYQAAPPTESGSEGSGDVPTGTKTAATTTSEPDLDIDTD